MKAENRKRNVSLENVRNEWKIKGRKRRWNKIAGENMNRDELKWLFFDMGSTLIDESVAIEHRIREVIEGTDITYEQFLEKKVFFAKQNKPADLATLEYFGLKKTPWHKEDERLYPEASECLEYLHKHFKIGIIANQSAGSEERLERFGIRKYIDIVVASAEEGVAKPDRKIRSLKELEELVEDCPENHCRYYLKKKMK